MVLEAKNVGAAHNTDVRKNILLSITVIDGMSKEQIQNTKKY